MEGGNEEIEWIYDCILQIVKSPEFRNPINFLWMITVIHL